MTALKFYEAHAAKRALERYDISYTSDVKKDLVKRIHRAKKRNFTRHEETFMIGKIKQGAVILRESWAIVIDGRRVDVVYDPTQRTIVTFLTPP